MPSRRARASPAFICCGSVSARFCQTSGQPLIAALLGGVFVGVGVGLVVRAGGASGGDDVLALLLNKFTKLTLSKSYFMTDAIVLALSLTYIPAGRIVFSFITVTLSSFLIERIQRIGAPCAAAEQGA